MTLTTGSTTFTRTTVAVGCGLMLMASCGLPTTPAVADDAARVIDRVEWIDWSELPAAAQDVHPPDDTVGAAVLPPGSDSQLLPVAVWHNSCRPAVRISTSESIGPELSMAVAIDHRETSCNDILKTWLVAVHLCQQIPHLGVPSSSHPGGTPG